MSRGGRYQSNNIFVNPEIHDIYIMRIGFSLIRVHLTQVNNVTAASGMQLMSNFKWPVESIAVSLRPSVNISSANANEHRDWHRSTLMTDHVIDDFSTSSGAVMTDDTVAYNATSIKHKKFSSQQAARRLIVPIATETIDTLKVQTHNIDIFRQLNAAFFNSYLPYTFGAGNLSTPEDPGCLFVNFCLYPGTYQPSGHINISRTREFYIIYTSSYVDASHTADLVCVATAINFLLISDGSAVLRYTT